jgi:hypothetical protein
MPSRAGAAVVSYSVRF